MKNFKSVLSKVAIIFAVCFMFASFSPSLDGRVVVVEQGEFPQGLFAKTVGYFPGDIISVANILSGNTVDLLVIGALDPSEGVAIMITPEAAQAIGIDKDSNNIVKITKRSGHDERVYGTAVIGKQNFAQTEDKNPYENEYDFEDDQAEINETEFDNNPEDFSTNELLEEENQEFEEEAKSAPENENFESPKTEEAPQEENFELIEEENDVFVDETEETAALEDEETFEEEFIAEQLFEETPEEDAFEEEAEKIDEIIEENENLFEDNQSEEITDGEYIEEEFEVPIESEKVEDEIPDFKETEEIPAEPFVEEEFESEIAEAPSEEPEILQEEIPAQEEFEEEWIDDYNGEELAEDILSEPVLPDDDENEIFEPEDAEPEFEEENEDFEIDDVEFAEEEDEINDDEISEEDFEYEDDEYAAIVLVPADSMPPASNEAETSDLQESDENEDFESETAFEFELQENAATENRPEKENKREFSYEKYIVENLSELESGKYYVQIATLSIDANIAEIANKYGNNYPIAIVPTAGGIRKQILIGPLTVDEYALVLERFRSYGFKDAFLRKIK